MSSSYFFDYYFGEEQISHFIKVITVVIFILLALFFTLIIRYRTFIGSSIPLFLVSLYLIINASISLYQLPKQRKNLIEMVEQKSKQIQHQQVIQIQSKSQQQFIFQITITCILVILLVLIVLTYKQKFWKSTFISALILCSLLLCFEYIDYMREKNFLSLINDYDAINNLVK